MDRKRVFIDLRPIIERKSIIKIVQSPRSDGKTTAGEKVAFESWEKTGKICTWVRRFWTEYSVAFDDFKATFIANLLAVRPDLDGRLTFRGSCKKGFRLYCDEKPCVLFIAITTAMKLKSAFDYKTHKNIVWDEYFIVGNGYVPKEITTLLELYRTIDRDHFDNYMLILGNKMGGLAPIYDFFNINVDTLKKKGINTLKNGSIDVMRWSNAGNIEQVKQTAFSDLVSGTEYAVYTAGGDLSAPDVSMICSERTNRALISIIEDGQIFTLYIAKDPSRLIFDSVEPKDAVPLYCIRPQARAPQAVFLSACPSLVKMLYKYKTHNGIFFATEKVAKQLSEVYKAIH